MIKGSQLRDAIISGSNNLINNKKYVDDLNIFPVPDGDTGTNMSMTISAASAKLAELDDDVSVCDVAKIAASTMLRGARGNSGVILSLLFRGFSKGLEGKETANGTDLVKALSIGVDAAYKAVMKPTEGTILTVARVGGEVGTVGSEIHNDTIYVWNAVCTGATEALAKTPEQLPVLKKAGVVDAGGQGLCMIFDGMLSVFKTNLIVELKEQFTETNTEEFFASVAAEFDSVITFTYCTEFIVGRDPECETDPLELRAYLETIGDCVVVVDDDDIIKTHVHTENPGNALQKALEFGSLLTVKIENMREQHENAKAANEKAKQEFKAKTAKTTLEKIEPTEDFGFVAVSAGDGLNDVFTDLGCTHVVSGGQTMNPSTEDILEAVLATPAKVVYVLPNNKNIIMASEQVIPLVTDREVIVIPTRTIPQGLAAMLGFDPDSNGALNKEAMMEIASTVDTGLVTFAARDSEYGGHKISEGEILGLINGKMTYVEKDIQNAAFRVTRNLVKRHDSTSFITIIHGDEVSAEDAEKLYEKVNHKYGGGDIEVTLINGGQPVYYYIVSVE